MTRLRATVLVFLFLAMNKTIPGQELDRPHFDREVDYYPQDGHSAATNPPFFRWLPPGGEVDAYILQYSRNASFPEDGTTTVSDLQITIHIPTQTLEPGTWHWRYGTRDGDHIQYSRAREFEIPETAMPFPYIPVDEAIARIPHERPRLNFTPEQVEKIRSGRSGEFADLKEKTVAEAEKILAMEEPLFEEPKPWEEYEDPRAAYIRSWRSMRPYTRRMVTCALAYLYTADEHFAAEARRRLMHFMSWDVEGPSSATGRTELGMNIAENATPVFDWIHDTLSEEERELCRRVLAARMHQITYQVHRARPMETQPFSSHPGRMVGFVVEGSIALAHEVPEAADWLDYTMKLLWSTYPAWGYADGGWAEGVSYWGGYMRRMIRVVAQLERFGIPLSDKPFFQNTGYFGLYAAYPGRPVQAFGDSHELPVGPAPAHVMYALSTLYQNPYFRWHAETAGAFPDGRTFMLTHDPNVIPKPPSSLPQSRIFHDVGLVAMHSNLAELENNVALLFQSNPFGAQSHNFACQNAFVIEAYGEPLAISTGSRQEHGSPHHREWMWHTHAHNSILVDGEGQVTRDRNSRGKIIAHQETGDWAYTAGDATEAYGGRLQRFHRHILFIRPDTFVVVDDLQTNGSDSTFQWLLHGPTPLQVNTENQVVVSRSGHARLTLRFLTPQDLDYHQHTGFTPQVEYPDQMWNQFHLTASTRQPASSRQFVTILQVDRTTGEPVRRPSPPTTPQYELPLSEIEDHHPLPSRLLAAELLGGNGGLAIRIGDDLILWKDPEAPYVQAAGVSTNQPMVFFQDFFP